jgi:ubiquinone/menaquinone biosynthesis C-methylase UbiE
MTNTTVPNHHANYPPFHGVRGVIAALSMLADRDGLTALAIELVELGPADHLVDIGCGPGAGVRLAAATAASVVGIDPAKVMLDVARVGVRRKNVRWELGSAEHLPVNDRSATVVWSVSAVHHWDDISGGLAEVVRVLRPGGRFVAIEKRVDQDATGHGSHGWTRPQADAFATACRAADFAVVEVIERTAGDRPVLAVLAGSGREP